MGGPTPRIMHALALGLAFLGCGLTVYADGSGLPIMGVALACAASVIYALYLILSHRQIQSLPPIAAAMLVSGGAASLFGRALFIAVPHFYQLRLANGPSWR